jgi:hypothetical protein
MLLPHVHWFGIVCHSPCCFVQRLACYRTLCTFVRCCCLPAVCPLGTFLNSTDGSSSTGTCSDCPISRWCPGGNPKARRATDNIGGASRGCNPEGSTGLTTKGRRSTRVNDCGALLQAYVACYCLASTVACGGGSSCCYFSAAMHGNCGSWCMCSRCMQCGSKCGKPCAADNPACLFDSYQYHSLRCSALCTPLYACSCLYWICAAINTRRSRQSCVCTAFLNRSPALLHPL